MDDTLETVIVVPCYNEANRLRKELFSDFIKRNEQIQILFVNDGSNDRTLDALENICSAAPRQLHLLDLVTNRGKAEAVRSGFVEAFKLGPTFVAMWDADLSTPLTEVIEFVKFLRNNEHCLLVMGARVKLLGRNIKRSGLRHTLGRLSATLISYTLGLDVYDTQCGAKLFRVNELTKLIFSCPFQSTWIFDVEVIARLITATAETFERPPIGCTHQLIYEFPLHEWTEIPGSKIRASHYAKSLVELIRIKTTYLCHTLVF